MNTDIAEKDLARICEAARAEGNLPGCAIAMVHAGKVIGGSAGAVSLGAAAPFDKNTRVPIACISEVLLGLVGCVLAEDASFDWDEPIPECELTHSESVITARDLLANSSGLDFDQDPSLDEVRLCGRSIFRPGQFSSRSIWNIRLLHALFDRMSPGCVERFLTNNIADSPDEKSLFKYETCGYSIQRCPTVAVRPVANGIPNGRAIDRLSLGTMAIAELGYTFVQGLRAKSGAINPDVLRALFVEYPYACRDDEPPRRVLPWYEVGDGMFSSAGHYPGHNAFLLISPENDVSIAATTNADSPSFVAHVLKAITGNLPPARSFEPRSPQGQWRAATNIDCIPGSYTAHGQTLQVRRRGSALHLSGRVGYRTPAIEHDDTPLRQYPDGTFVAWRQPSEMYQPSFVRFLSVASSDGAPQFMRFDQQVFRRTSA